MHVHVQTHDNQLELFTSICISADTMLGTKPRLVTGASSAGTERRRERRSRTSDEGGSESEGQTLALVSQSTNGGSDRRQVLSARDQMCTNKDRKSKNNRKDIQNT